jgi:hypothetical protein
MANSCFRRENPWFVLEIPMKTGKIYSQNCINATEENLGEGMGLGTGDWWLGTGKRWDQGLGVGGRVLNANDLLKPPAPSPQCPALFIVLRFNSNFCILLAMRS